MAERTSLDEHLARAKERRAAKAAWSELRRELAAAQRAVACAQPFDEEAAATAIDAVSAINEAIPPLLAALGFEVEPIPDNLSADLGEE